MPDFLTFRLSLTSVSFWELPCLLQRAPKPFRPILIPHSDMYFNPLWGENSPLRICRFSIFPSTNSPRPCSGKTGPSTNVDFRYSIFAFMCIRARHALLHFWLRGWDPDQRSLVSPITLRRFDNCQNVEMYKPIQLRCLTKLTLGSSWNERPWNA